LKRRGFKNVKDLSGLEEGDIDFKVKPVHRTRLLWVATTQKMFLQEDGEKLPDVEKVKVDAAEDPVPERATPRPKRPPGKKPPPGKKAPPGNCFLKVPQTHHRMFQALNTTSHDFTFTCFPFFPFCLCLREFVCVCVCSFFNACGDDAGKKPPPAKKPPPKAAAAAASGGGGAEAAPEAAVAEPVEDEDEEPDFLGERKGKGTDEGLVCGILVLLLLPLLRLFSLCS
jgi:hypothetical protein